MLNKRTEKSVNSNIDKETKFEKGNDHERIYLYHQRRRLRKEGTETNEDVQGTQARPAGELVKAASAYPCKVTISKDGKEVDAKRILGVMGLGVKCGQEIVLKTDGDQEEEAIAALGKFLEEKL